MQENVDLAEMIGTLIGVGLGFFIGFKLITWFVAKFSRKDKGANDKKDEK